jgi:hypothetical protein
MENTMKTMITKTFFGLSGLLLIATFAVADGKQAKDFDKLDKNQDGVLSAAEASGSADLSTRWTNADMDGSGSIDRAEFSAFETEEVKEGQSDKSMQQPEKENAKY